MRHTNKLFPTEMKEQKIIGNASYVNLAELKLIKKLCLDVMDTE